MVDTGMFCRASANRIRGAESTAQFLVPWPVQRTTSLQQNCPPSQQDLGVTWSCLSWRATCGLYLLLYGFWMIGMRLGASDTSSRFHARALGGSHPETRYTTSASAFFGIPQWSFSLEGRRLPVDQPPHLQHHNAPSRNPYCCERCAEPRPKGLLHGAEVI